MTAPQQIPIPQDEKEKNPCKPPEIVEAPEDALKRMIFIPDQPLFNPGPLGPLCNPLTRNMRY